MNRLMRTVQVTAGLALVVGGLSSAPAYAEATTIDCGLIEPGVEGVLVITPNGQVRANCHEHIFDQTGGPAEGEAITVDCVEVVGEGPGVAVITPSGNTLVNCHIHVG